MDAPTCLRAAGPCEPATVVAATCDGRAWRCPSGTREHARLSAASTCLPFFEPGGPIRALEGSLVRVPTADRCLWIGETVETSAGSLRNVAFEVDPTAPYGTCPARATFRAESVVELDGGADPELQVQITGAQRLAGVTRVTYRLFRLDPSAGFGVRELGTGIGRFDEARQRIVVSPRPRFAPDLDLGDASFVSDRLYVYGCPPPIDFLTEGCVVARFDARDDMELFAGGGKWIESARGRDGAEVFRAGPWISAIARDGDRLVHLYSVGFGSTLATHFASAPEGPWTDGPELARCALPEDDPKAFCAGPVVHEELVDPTRSEWVVSYGVGTTASDGAARRAARPEAYWTRLHWIGR